MLQGTGGLDFSLRGDRWALYRYMQAFEAIARVHPGAPALPFWYLHDPTDERRAQDEMIAYVRAIVEGAAGQVTGVQEAVIARVREVMRDGVEGDIARDIASIDHRGDDVIVRIGAKPERKSWREKGSGQMDPYVGLILAAKYIYCYDESGKKVKDLILQFTYLPPDFWFFSNPDSTALYKTLPILFADEVRFLG